MMKMSKKKFKVSDRMETSIKKLVKKMNDSLYRLEKAGVTHESQFYQTLERYAIDKNSPLFNVDLETGKFRLSADLGRFDNKIDIYRYKELLEDMKQAQTRTVKGTKAAVEKAYDTFMSSPTHLVNPDLTFEGYREAFKIWRTKLEPDRKTHFTSEMMMDFLESTNIYEMNEEDIAAALQYGADHSEKQLLKYYFNHPRGTNKYQYVGRKSYTPNTKGRRRRKK